MKENKELKNSIERPLGFSTKTVLIQMSKTVEMLFQEILVLEESLKNGNMNLSDTALRTEMIKKDKEKIVLEICNVNCKDDFRKENKIRPDGSSYQLYVCRVKDFTGKVKDKRIRAMEYDDFIDKIYSFYFSQDNSSIERLFTQYMERMRVRVNNKTIKAKSVHEYKRLWDKYLAADTFVTKKVNGLMPNNWKAFIKRLVEINGLTFYEFSNIRVILNGILSIAVEEGYIISNPLRDLNYKDISFAYDDRKKVKSKAFPNQNAETILRWSLTMAKSIIDGKNDLRTFCNICNIDFDEKKLPKDFRKKTSKITPGTFDISDVAMLPVKASYYLALALDLFLGLRFGEIKALKWKNVDWDKKTILIDEQCIPTETMNEDLTFTYLGRQNAGELKCHEMPDLLPITDTLKDILIMLQSLNLSNEEFFPQGSLRYNSFNTLIKLAAKYSGLDPFQYHPHCLRATAATVLHEKSNNVKLVQRVMRHTTPAMTDKYIQETKSITLLPKVMNSMYC